MKRTMSQSFADVANQLKLPKNQTNSNGNTTSVLSCSKFPTTSMGAKINSIMNNEPTAQLFSFSSSTDQLNQQQQNQGLPHNKTTQTDGGESVDDSATATNNNGMHNPPQKQQQQQEVLSLLLEHQKNQRLILLREHQQERVLYQPFMERQQQEAWQNFFMLIKEQHKERERYLSILEGRN